MCKYLSYFFQFFLHRKLCFYKSIFLSHQFPGGNLSPLLLLWVGKRSLHPSYLHYSFIWDQNLCNKLQLRKILTCLHHATQLVHTCFLQVPSPCSHRVRRGFPCTSSINFKLRLWADNWTFPTGYPTGIACSEHYQL